jgi:hypothetical protein
MVGLLDLPSELLFIIIIDLVLSSPTVQPKNGTRYRTTRWSTWDRNLYCIPSLHFERPRAINLLLLNQRMYIETREYLSKAPRNFEVDIAIINDRWLWPTRRVVPVRKLDGIIERIDLNIIPCCTEGKRSLQTECGIIGQDIFQLNSGSFVTEAFLAPLTYFLLYPQTDVSLDKPISNVFRGLEIWVDPLLDTQPTDQLDDEQDLPVTRIDTVAIFIDTSRYGNGNENLSPAVVPWRKVEGLAHLDFEQLYPVDCAKSEHYLRGLGSLIDEWAYVWANKRVGERIGKIQFHLDEKMWKELDFAKRPTDV